MNTKLLDFLQDTLAARYPGLPSSDIRSLVEESLTKKKYDAQDEAIIEVMIGDKDRLFEKSFIEDIEDYMKKNGLEGSREVFFMSEEGRNRIAEIFVAVLENLIDYFYNALLNQKFFTS